MPAATEGMITGCRPSLRCSRTTAVRTLPTFTTLCEMTAFTSRREIVMAKFLLHD
jgi:hypothetical protein